MTSQGIPLQTYTLPWLMCLFTTGTPAETTLQVWDLMLLGSAPHRCGAASRDQEGEPGHADGGGSGHTTHSNDDCRSPSSSSSSRKSSSSTNTSRLNKDTQSSSLTQSDCALNILLLLIVGMFSLLAKDIEKAKDPQSLTGLIKQLVRCRYDCHELLTTAVEVAGKDRKSWSSEWSWHGLLAPIRQRLSKTISLQKVRTSHLASLKTEFADAGAV